MPSSLLSAGMPRWSFGRAVPAPGDAAPLRATGYYDYRGTATARDLPGPRTAGLFPTGRFVVPRSGRRRREIWLPADAVRSHTLVVGPSRAGKTSSIVVPWAAAALRAGYATVVADVKGDLVPCIGAELLATGAPPIRAAVLDYRSAASSGWAFVRELGDERRLAAAAHALVGQERLHDPQPFFWQRDVRLVTGLLTAAHATRRPVPFTELLAAAHDQRALGAYVEAYAPPRARMLLHDALIADAFDYPKVMSGVVNALDALAVPAVDAITATDALRLDDALSAPGLLAFGAPIGDGRLGRSFAALVLNLLVERLHDRHGRPSHPVMLFIDEAARLADRVDLEEILSTAAAANVAIVLATQDIAQLPEGRVRDGVLANCQTVVSFPGVGATTAQAFSDRLGHRPEIQVAVQRHSRQLVGRTFDRRQADVPVLGAREITDPPFGGRCAIVHSRPLTSRPFITDLTRALP